MRPDIRRELRWSYGILAGAAILGGLITWGFWWYADDTLSERTKEEETHTLRTGPINLASEIEIVRTSIDRVRADNTRYKGEVGMKLISPFELAKEQTNRGYWCGALYDQIRFELQDLGRNHSLVYNSEIGFNRTGDIPDAEAQYWATMLQHISRVAWLTMYTNRFPGRLSGIKNFSIEPITIGKIVPTGPVGRPALLREYPFKLKVTGSLVDILWLIHQVTDKMEPEVENDLLEFYASIDSKVNSKTPGFKPKDPSAYRQTGRLILGGYDIQARNRKSDDAYVEHTVILHLAAMDFLSDEERGAGVVRKPTTQVMSRPP